MCTKMFRYLVPTLVVVSWQGSPGHAAAVNPIALLACAAKVAWDFANSKTPLPAKNESLILVGATLPQGRLALAKTSVIAITSSEYPLYRYVNTGLKRFEFQGKVSGTLIIPCEVNWSVDMDKIRWQINGRVLSIQMPTVEIDAQPVPDLAKRKFDGPHFDGIAFKLLESDEARIVSDRCLDQVQPEARREAQKPEHRAMAQRLAQQALKERLERLFKQNAKLADIVVDVRSQEGTSPPSGSR